MDWKRIKYGLAMFGMVALVVMAILFIGYYVWDNVIATDDFKVDRDFFEGSWLNAQEYDDATVELFFYNVFDNVVVYTRELGEEKWGTPDITDFDIFYNGEEGYYKNHILSFDDIVIDKYSMYLCSFWELDDRIFEIYYDGEYMRFYKADVSTFNVSNVKISIGGK